MKFDLLIHDTSEVLTCDGSLEGAAELTLAPIHRGAIGIEGGKIAWLGQHPPKDAVGPDTRLIDARGGFAGPGFVECHSHLVFAGDRADEFEQRCQGKSYLELAAAGGGIQRTVRDTRAASFETLLRLALPRLDRLLRQGVTTVEIKSGYGLDVENELKMLRVIRELEKAQPAMVVATALLLHAVPPEHRHDRAGWLRRCTEALLPAVHAEGLARFCDAFVEEAAFTHDEARTLLTRARQLGLKLRLHVDQLTQCRGAELAAELGAVSADHLEQISPQGVSALRASGTIAVLAPTSTLFLKVRPWAPGRALRDAGVPVAVSTNCNPGSSMSENVFLALGLACVENGLSPAEAYLGFTRVAGLALADPRLGRLFVGGPADVVVYAVDSYRQLPYHFGVSDVGVVLKSGRVV